MTIQLKPEGEQVVGRAIDAGVIRAIDDRRAHPRIRAQMAAVPER